MSMPCDVKLLWSSTASPPLYSVSEGLAPRSSLTMPPPGPPGDRGVCWGEGQAAQNKVFHNLESQATIVLSE